MRTFIIPAASILTCCLACAQPADKTLTFDAASIKPAALPTANGRGMIMMRGPSGGPGSKDPGRINYSYISLKTLVMNAYDVKNFQITGADWLDKEMFDVQATMPPETTKEQFRVMLQNLLAERFKLTIHRETKDLPMYTLVVGKNGPKMKESVEAPPPPPTDPDAPPPSPMAAFGPGGLKMGPDGFPILPSPNGGRGGMSTMMMPGRARLGAQKQTMQDLATRLSSMLNHPVTDATDLKAKYDFTLTYSPEGLSGGAPGRERDLMAMARAQLPPGGGEHGPTDAPEAEPAENLFSAVQSQLGLKLEPKKGPVEIIIIDHMEKTPTEN